LTRLERSIALVLTWGVRISSVCLAVGLLLTYAATAAGLSEVILRTGILVLIVTPVARVLISTVQYAAQRDWQFATLTAIVLLELVGSAVAALVFNRRL
jgi:uncharacterized membrane protein